MRSHLLRSSDRRGVFSFRAAFRHSDAIMPRVLVLSSVPRSDKNSSVVLCRTACIRPNSALSTHSSSHSFRTPLLATIAINDPVWCPGRYCPSNETYFSSLVTAFDFLFLYPSMWRTPSASTAHCVSKYSPSTRWLSVSFEPSM